MTDWATKSLREVEKIVHPSPVLRVVSLSCFSLPFLIWPSLSEVLGGERVSCIYVSFRTIPWRVLSCNGWSNDAGHEGDWRVPALTRLVQRHLLNSFKVTLNGLVCIFICVCHSVLPLSTSAFTFLQNWATESKTRHAFSISQTYGYKGLSGLVKNSAKGHGLIGLHDISYTWYGEPLTLTK